MQPLPAAVQGHRSPGEMVKEIWTRPPVFAFQHSGTDIINQLRVHGRFETRIGAGWIQPLAVLSSRLKGP